MKNISIIAVIARKRAIGKNNKLLARVPGDLPRLKKITKGHKVIVGRKTLESFPKGKPLPGRTFIVLTKNKNYENDNVIVVHSVKEAISLCAEDEEVFCMGGGEIYKLFLPFANKMYLTLIWKYMDADTFFPKYDLRNWILVDCESHMKKEKCDFGFLFMDYRKIK